MALLNAVRAKQYMKQCQVEALVATSAANVKYFSGYSCWLDPLFKEYMMNPGASSTLAQPSYALFPFAGEPALIVKSLMATDAADLELTDLRLYGDSGVDHSLASAGVTSTESRFVALLRKGCQCGTPGEALAAALRDRGLMNATVGLEMEGLSLEAKSSLQKAAPGVRFLDCTNLIRLIRVVKTPKEVDLLARAAEIAEKAAMESLASARAGGRARDLVQHFRIGVAEQGAAVDHFSFSLSGLGICGELDYVFRPQEIVFIDYGCIFSSYFSDSGTTLAFSDLCPEMAKRYAALKLCIEAGAQAMRPGVKSSVIQKTMNDVLYENRVAGAFPHGHGLGLELRDYPILVPANGLEIRDDCIAVDSDLPMEEGMVNNLEAPLFMSTAGALHIEKSFLVTAHGSRELVHQDRTGPYCAA